MTSTTHSTSVRSLLLLTLISVTAAACSSSGDSATEEAPRPAKVKDTTAEAVAPASAPAPALTPSKTTVNAAEQPSPDAGTAVVTRKIVDVPASKQLAETSGLALTTLTMAIGVEGRVPVEPGTNFEVGAQEKIYVYLEIANPSKEKTELVVSWLRPGATEGKWSRKVKVGPQKKWRTWAYARPKASGEWAVQVADLEGNVLGTAPFNMTN